MSDSGPDAAPTEDELPATAPDGDVDEVATSSTSWFRSAKGVAAGVLVAAGLGIGAWLGFLQPADDEPAIAGGHAEAPEEPPAEAPLDETVDDADDWAALEAAMTGRLGSAVTIAFGLQHARSLPDPNVDSSLTPEQRRELFFEMASQALAEVTDPLGDISQVFEESVWSAGKGTTRHSSDDLEPLEPKKPWTNLISAGEVTIDPGDDAASWVQDAFGNTIFPCGHGPVAFTVCPFDPGPLATGRHLVVFAAFDGEIPLEAGPEEYYTYGFAFDGDADPSNNFVPRPEFPNDFFLGTDLWYSLEWEGSGWRLAVTDARAGRYEPVASSARVLVRGDTVALVVPEQELDAATAPYRITSFWHRGDFGMDPPHEWSGDVQPPVDEPLVTPDGSILRAP